ETAGSLQVRVGVAAVLELPRQVVAAIGFSASRKNDQSLALEVVGERVELPEIDGKPLRDVSIRKVLGAGQLDDEVADGVHGECLSPTGVGRRRPPRKRCELVLPPKHLTRRNK